jgi:hypothetical protein
MLLTVNTIVKYDAGIKEHVKESRKHEGAISEMEKLLTMWMEVYI